MREYLEIQNSHLSQADENGYAYYKEVRSQFNQQFDSLDFIFLSRAGFNGMMRFNKKGEWNIPFCKKPGRFAASYVTKICNQVDNIQRIKQSKKWDFINTSFENIIERAGDGDLIYCDPPIMDDMLTITMDGLKMMKKNYSNCYQRPRLNLFYQHGIIMHIERMR